VTIPPLGPRAFAQAAGATRAAAAPTPPSPQDSYAASAPAQEDEAVALMTSVERRGIWETWKVEPNLARLRSGLREGESLLDAVRSYEILFDVEHRNGVDPSPKALKAYELVESTLRPGESRLEAAQAYADLWVFERRYRDLDPTSWCHQDWPAIDAQVPPTGDRRSAVRIFAQGPEKFEQAMTAERGRLEQRDAEVRRMAEAATTPQEAPTLEVEPDWIVVGGVSLPRRAV